jgi:hypothetical protein
MPKPDELRDKIAEKAFSLMVANLPKVSVLTPLSPGGLQRHREYFVPFIAAALDDYAKGQRVALQAIWDHARLDATRRSWGYVNVTARDAIQAEDGGEKS